MLIAASHSTFALEIAIASTVIENTFQSLQGYAEKYDAALVSYSDGKDSRAVMDMALRTFKRVEAFFMYLIPDLECMNTALAQAEKKWGIKIRQYPHWTAARFIKNGVYCNPSWKLDEVKEYKLHDVYALAMSDTGCRIVLTGQKKSDSVSRRKLMSLQKNIDVVHPMAEWNKFEVLQYLAMRKIPLPPSCGDTAGIDLTDRSLIWLSETYPQDFQKLLEYFPYAEAAVMRRKFYGIVKETKIGKVGK